MAWIDVGAAATDRDAYASGGTLINLDNPANISGIIEEIQIYVRDAIQGCKVGTFYGSEGSFTMRDYVSVGSLSAESKSTIDGLSIDVQAGDYLGIYFTSGNVETGSSGGAGVYYKNGVDAFTGEEVTGFSLASGYVMSVYGVGFEVVEAECAVSAAASMSALATGPEYAEASISAVPSMTVAAGAVYPASASMTTAASLAALATRVLPSAVVSILASGSLSAEGRIQIPATVSISVVPSVVAAGALTAKGAVTIAVTPSVAAQAMAILDGIVSIDAISSVYAQCIGTQFCTVNIEAVPSVSALATADWNGAAAIAVVSSVSAVALAYVTKTMGFGGTLSASDVLVIDTDNRTVTLNGANAREDFTGEFWELFDGTNEIAWHSDAAPTAELKVEHKPRWL